MDDNGFIRIGKIVVFFAHFSLILSALPLPLTSSVFLFAYCICYILFVAAQILKYTFLLLPACMKIQMGICSWYKVQGWLHPTDWN
jgi:hypothetical protein